MRTTLSIVTDLDVFAAFPGALPTPLAFSAGATSQSRSRFRARW